MFQERQHKMSELAELRQEIAKMEERVVAAISTMGKSVGDDLGVIQAALEVVNENHLAIRAALEVISENHLAPEHQHLVKRKLASVGKR